MKGNNLDPLYFFYTQYLTHNQILPYMQKDMKISLAIKRKRIENSRRPVDDPDIKVTNQSL